VTEREKAYAQVEGMRTGTTIQVSDPNAADVLWELARSLDRGDVLSVQQDLQGSRIFILRSRREN
jgi:hypothetical protein